MVKNKSINFFYKKILIFLMSIFILTILLSFNIKIFANNLINFDVFLGYGYFNSSELPSYIILFPFLNFNFYKNSSYDYLNLNLTTLLTYNEKLYKILNGELNLKYRYLFTNKIFNLDFFAFTNDLPSLKDENLPSFLTGTNISFSILSNFITKIIFYTDYKYFIHDRSDNFDSYLNLNFFIPFSQNVNVNFSIKEKIYSKNQFTDNYFINNILISPIFYINPTISISINFSIENSYLLDDKENYFLTIFYNVNYLNILNQIITINNLIHFQYYKYYTKINNEEEDNILIKNNLNLQFNLLNIIINYSNLIQSYFYTDNSLSYLVFGNKISSNFNITKNFILIPSFNYLTYLNLSLNLITKKEIKINIDLNLEYQNIFVNFSNSILFILTNIKDERNLSSIINIIYKINNNFLLKTSLNYKIIFDKLNNVGEDLLFFIFGINYYF